MIGAKLEKKLEIKHFFGPANVRDPYFFAQDE